MGASLVLAMDCSAAACSVAVGRDGVVLAHQRGEMSRGHAAALAPMIEAVMGQAGLPHASLDAVGVTIGPGSFTGIRIGLATARGLGLALDRPVIGVSAMAAVAARCVTEGARANSSAWLVVLETKRADLYVQAFDRDGAELSEPTISPLADLAEFATRSFGDRAFRLAGDGAERARDLLAQHAGEPAHPEAPDARWVLELAGRRLAEGGELEPPRPLYLRAPEVGPPGR